LKKGWEKFSRTVVTEKGDVRKGLAKQLSGLKVNENMVKQAVRELELDLERPDKWNEEQLKALAVKLRQVTKPTIIAANKIDIPGAEKNYERLKKEFSDYLIVPCSAESELGLKEAAKHELIDYIPGENTFTITKEDTLNDKQKKALSFIQDTILKSQGHTGVQTTLDQAVFTFLKYVAIFPGGVNKLEDQHGNTLPDCFLMPPESTALSFAYRLHSTFGDNFIRAVQVKTKKTIGKEYTLQHRDVIEIISGK